MSFFRRFFAKPEPVSARRKLDVEIMRSILAGAIKGNTQPNYRPIWTKGTAACVTKTDIEGASQQSHSPWVKSVWECEDQARSLIEVAQRRGANEGHTLALGMLFGDSPNPHDESRHVYIFGIDHGGAVIFFDPTSCKFCSCPSNIYFSLL